MPLIKKMGNESPLVPCPNEYAQIARNAVATVSLQKFASVPPSNFADCVAHTTDVEKRKVVNIAGSTQRIAADSRT
jgi:hypothetical protein